MNIDTNDMISISEVSKHGVSKLVNEASEGREFILIKNNKPAAALVGIDKLERLQRVEEDVKLLTMAIVRAATDTGGGRQSERCGRPLRCRPRRARRRDR